LHHIFSLGNYCERLCAPERMTDERRRLRQNSGNLKKFQAGHERIDGRDCEGGYPPSIRLRANLRLPKNLARSVHDLHFEPKYEEFRRRTIWSLSNAFTSAFKELDPIPQFKATAKLGEFLEARFSQSF
jgi:hypothetical protein